MNLGEVKLQISSMVREYRNQDLVLRHVQGPANSALLFAFMDNAPKTYGSQYAAIFEDKEKVTAGKTLEILALPKAYSSVFHALCGWSKLIFRQAGYSGLPSLYEDGLVEFLQKERENGFDIDPRLIKFLVLGDVISREDTIYMQGKYLEHASRTLKLLHGAMNEISNPVITKFDDYARIVRSDYAQIKDEIRDREARIRQAEETKRMAEFYKDNEYFGMF